jgi:dolichol kinase
MTPNRPSGLSTASVEDPSARALSFRREVARKAVHLVTAVVPVAYAAGLPRRILVIMLGVAAGAALIIERVRARHAGTRAHFERLFGPLLRDHEWTKLSGATWLALALLGLALVAPHDVAIAGMWAVCVGDAAAALVGRVAARRPGGGGRKTFAGSAACFAVTLAGAVALAHLSVAEGLIGAACATVGEWPANPGDDNIRIAVAVFLGISLWRMLFS